MKKTKESTRRRLKMLIEISASATAVVVMPSVLRIEK